MLSDEKKKIMTFESELLKFKLNIWVWFWIQKRVISEKFWAYNMLVAATTEIIYGQSL